MELQTNLLSKVLTAVRRYHLVSASSPTGQGSRHRLGKRYGGVCPQKNGNAFTKRQDWVDRGSRLPRISAEERHCPADTLAARPPTRRHHPV